MRRWRNNNFNDSTTTSQCILPLAHLVGAYHDNAKSNCVSQPPRPVNQDCACTHKHGTIDSISAELITEVYKVVDRVVTIHDAGSTALIIVRIGRRLYMANAGDSTSYICIYEPPAI
jgi:serine/threonine protein phosphatase PrpC